MKDLTLNTTQMKVVLVATDLSRRADEAILSGDIWARRHGARLVVVHVAPDLVGVNPLFPERTQEQHTAQLDLLETAKHALGDRVRAVAGRDADELLTVSGEPHRQILALATQRHADLIVVGDSGQGGIARALFGRTVLKVLRGADVPVLVARPSKAHGPTIAATDFSDPAAPAVYAAAADALARKAPLVLFHAIDLLAVGAYSASASAAGFLLAPGLLTEQLASAARLRLEGVAGALGQPAEVRVGVAGPAPEIVALAEETHADLVVVGTHGRSGVSRLVMGSVAESVVMNVTCPVLVVRLAA